MISTSIIITTYNWPQALALVLKALNNQSSGIEVIIADDGSNEDTSQLLTKIQTELDFPLQHIWQPDDGFQAAKIRNKAVAHAKGDYLIFLDGDCIPTQHFIRKHLQLAERGWLVAGNRVLLNQTFSQRVIRERIPVHTWNFKKWFQTRLKRDCNRILPMFSLPIQLPLRKLKSQIWQGVKTCNLALWKEDFIAVNGFDESYVGWGYEDSDLTIRLLKNGVRRKEGRYAVPVVHLWHLEQDRSFRAQNKMQLQKNLLDAHIKAELGINQYLKG